MASVSRGSDFHFACRLFGFFLGYAAYVSMHLVPCFAMFACHFRGDEVDCLEQLVEGFVACPTSDLCYHHAHRQPAPPPLLLAACPIAVMTDDTCLSSDSGQSPCLPLCLDLLCSSFVFLAYLSLYHVDSTLISHFGMVLLSFAWFTNASCIPPSGEHKPALCANISHTRAD